MEERGRGRESRGARYRHRHRLLVVISKRRGDRHRRLRRGRRRRREGRQGDENANGDGEKSLPWGIEIQEAAKWDRVNEVRSFLGGYIGYGWCRIFF